MGPGEHKILFICDRRACEHGNPECFHAENIWHAANFQMNIAGMFVERIEKAPEEDEA